MTFSTPPSGGGMPKWLIFALVALLVIMLGCCGGIVACKWACTRAAVVARSSIQAATQRAEIEIKAATQRAADEARRQAQQAATSVGAGGNAGGGSPTVSVGGGQPSNFPKDLPVMPGFTSAGVSISDSAQGTGMIMLSGKVARADVVAYYEQQMKDQGWTESNNVQMGENSTMIFTKDTRQAIIQANNSDGNIMLAIRYESKP